MPKLTALIGAASVEPGNHTNWHSNIRPETMHEETFQAKIKNPAPLDGRCGLSARVGGCSVDTWNATEIRYASMYLPMIPSFIFHQLASRFEKDLQQSIRSKML